MSQVLLQRNFAGEQFPAQFFTGCRNKKSLHPQRNLRSLNRALNRMRHESHLRLIRSYHVHCSTKATWLQTENCLSPCQILRRKMHQRLQREGHAKRFCGSRMSRCTVQKLRRYNQREVPTDFSLYLFKLTVGKSEFFDNSARSRWIFLRTAGMVCC